MTASRSLRHRPDPSLDFLAGGGELGADMRRKDWASTPLGDAARWPQSLRTSVSICLNSRTPVLVWWGPQLVMLYDAYRQLIGRKHPAALGQPGRECWPESIPARHRSDARRRALAGRVHLLGGPDAPAGTKGFPEECYFTFSYSPQSRRGRRGRRCLLLGGGDDIAGARCAPDPHAVPPAGGVRLGEPHRGGRARDVDGRAPGQRGRRAVGAVPGAGRGGAPPPVSVGLERPKVEALAPVLAASAGRVQESRTTQDSPSSSRRRRRSARHG